MNTPTAINEYVFSGSLCHIREFETDDGLHYCLTVFSLYDYKYLHLPHDEYKYLINKLSEAYSTQTRLPITSKSDVLSIKQLPFNDEFKIKFENRSLTIGPVTAFGLLNTSPFANVDVYSDCKNRFICDSKWDICICKKCPAFKRLVDFEAFAATRFSQRRLENVILFQN